MHFESKVPFGVFGNECIYKGFRFGVQAVDDDYDFFCPHLVEDAYEASAHGFAVKFDEGLGTCYAFLCQTAAFACGNYREFHKGFKGVFS